MYVKEVTWCSAALLVTSSARTSWHWASFSVRADRVSCRVVTWSMMMVTIMILIMMMMILTSVASLPLAWSAHCSRFGLATLWSSLVSASWGHGVCQQ